MVAVLELEKRTGACATRVFARWCTGLISRTVPSHVAKFATLETLRTLHQDAGGTARILASDLVLEASRTVLPDDRRGFLRPKLRSVRPSACTRALLARALLLELLLIAANPRGL